MSNAAKLSTLIARFVNDMRSLNLHTARSYENALKKFIAYDITLDNDALVSFERRLREDRRGYSAGTIDCRVVALRRFLCWLEANDRLPKTCNRAKVEVRLRMYHGRYRSGKRKMRHPDPRLGILRDYFDQLPEPETSRECLELLRNRALIHVLFSTAARVGEVCSLTRIQVADGNADEAEIVGKGNRERIIFLDHEAKQAIRVYCSARTDDLPALFVSHRTKAQTLSTHGVYEIVKRAARALRLAKNTSPHMIRHYVASRMTNKEVPLDVVQDFLGHADIKTTRDFYAETEPVRLRRHVKNYWRRNNQRKNGKSKGQAQAKITSGE